MKIGDWVKYVSLINGIKHTVAGPITDLFTVENSIVASVQINEEIIFKVITNLQKMTKSEIVLWKLEN
jgi:hypothetical protein